MKPSNKVREYFSGFIHFGNMMDKEMREEIAAIIFKHFYDSDIDGPAELKKSKVQEKYPEWGDLTRRLFRENSFRNLSLNNERLSRKITEEGLEWLKRAYFEFEADSEISQLSQKVQEFTNSKDSMENAEWIKMLHSLKTDYPEMKQAWKFYEKKLRKITEDFLAFTKSKRTTKRARKLNKKILAVKSNIKDDWNEVFQKRRLQRFEDILNPEITAFIGRQNRFYLRFEDFYLKISGFFGYLGRFWDLSEGVWQEIDWVEFDKYAKILEKEKEIQELAEILGRYQKSEEEYEKQLIEKTVIKTEWKSEAAGKSEIIGVHFSDDLSSLLPLEVALLSTPETEIIFSKNFIEKKLQTFEYRNKTRFEREEKKTEEIRKLKETKKGPIIACVDTSGSMHGNPERIAKTLIFALLKIALKDNRACFLISFSTAIKTLELTDIDHSISKMVDFLRMSFHGGTDATPAFLKAIDMLNTQQYKKADVIMVSDFIMPSLSENIEQQIKTQKENNKNKFHSLVITTEHNPHFLEIFDNNWIIDQTDYNSIKILTKDVFDSFRR